MTKKVVTKQSVHLNERNNFTSGRCVSARGRLLLCSLISSLTNCMTFWLTVANFVHHFAIENV